MSTTTMTMGIWYAEMSMTLPPRNYDLWKHTYNVENRLSGIQKITDGTCSDPSTITETWDFYYDGDGVRVKETYSGTGTAYTKLFLFGGLFEVENPGTGENITKYYTIAGMRVAMHDGDDLYYFATDHLSSASLVMDASGNMVSSQRVTSSLVDEEHRPSLN